MDELASKLESLRDGVVPAWTDARRERLLVASNKLSSRRRTQRLALYTGIPLASVIALVAVQLTRAPSVEDVRRAARSELRNEVRNEVRNEDEAAHVATALAVPEAAAVRPGTPVRLEDGSRVEVTSAQGELIVRRNERADVDLRLIAGRAHFDVVPNRERRFSVIAGSVEVIVVGTVFDVERVQGRVRVAVSHGKVRVRSAAGTVHVEAGGSNWFDDSDVALLADMLEETAPPAQAPSAPVAPGADDVAQQKPAAKSRSAESSRPVRPGPEGARVDWRSLCQSGDYKGAYALLEQGSPVGDDPEALMVAADAARLTNHPEAAAGYLRTVLRGRRGPMTPLAAFTLGRVMLEQLGRPSEAAAAFAQARQLAPESSLAQDSLAREVEAWSKAGHSDRAYERARTYVEQYPDGRRLGAVQLYGGLRTQ